MKNKRTIRLELSVEEAAELSFFGTSPALKEFESKLARTVVENDLKTAGMSKEDLERIQWKLLCRRDDEAYRRFYLSVGHPVPDTAHPLIHKLGKCLRLYQSVAATHITEELLDMEGLNFK